MDHEGAALWVSPQTVTNSMAGQDEHAYSLDHPQPPHSAKFNSRRDNSGARTRLESETPRSQKRQTGRRSAEFEDSVQKVSPRTLTEGYCCSTRSIPG